jgi:serine protease
VAFAIFWLRGRLASAPSQTAATPVATVEVGEAIPGEVVVDFRDDEPHDQIVALGQKLGVHFAPASSLVDVDEIYTVETGDPERLIEVLRADPDVEAADLELIYRLPEDGMEEDEGIPDENDPAHVGFPNDPKYKHQWHLEQIHAKQAWKGAQGDGVIVAVVDTGVAKVPDLAQTELVAGYNFVNNSSDATDDHGHGTHVAGTIAQSTHNGVGVAGVAFKAKIMPIKVLSARGSGSVSGIAEGIRFAADHGAKVINMSLGGPIASSVLAKAVKHAHDKGVTVVCAAGNDGRGKVSYPAAYPDAVAVAATQFDETTTFYSNWGKEIDVAAPGGNTRVDQNGDGLPDGVLQNTVVPGDTSRNDYLWFMGTSMASPHVAGVAALIISAGVTNPDQVEKILKDTARAPKGKKIDDYEKHYGAGIVDAAAAVKKAKEQAGHSSWPWLLAASLGYALLRRRRR